MKKRFLWLYPIGYHEKLFRIMKLCALLLFLAVTQVQATGYGQDVFTIKEKGITVKKAIREIEKNSNYAVFYRIDQIDLNKKLNIDATNVTIEKLMPLILQGQPLSYKVLENTVVIKPATSRQPLYQEKYEIEVQGTVYDSAGMGTLAGVTVQEKGTNNATTTDMRGRYSISVKDNNAVLIFTYVGFIPKEIALNNQSTINVSLARDNSELNQVVVVAYGTQKKINLTGAVDQVSGKVLQDRPITNLSEGLQGALPNLNITTNGSGGAPGASKSINLRGYTGLGVASSPLILVDGVPTDIDMVNPSDVESISVLKDAASSAIYGSRAPNGVILITTKQGNKNQPLRINYNNNFSSSQNIHLLKSMNSLDWANLYNEAAINAGQGQFIPSSVIDRIRAYLKDPVNTPATIADPNGVSWGAYDNTFGNANTDWYKVWMRKSQFNQAHNLSVDGGSGKIAYFMGLGYTKKGGMYNYYDDGYDRYNFRANITADVNKWVTFKLKTSYALENFDYPYGGGSATGGNWFHQIARIWPIIPVYAPNGGYIFEGNSGVPLLQSGGSLRTKNNDAWIIGEATIRPLKGWEITGSYGYNYFTSKFSSSALPFYYSTQQSPNTLSTTISSISKSQSQDYYRKIDVYSSYERKIGGHYFKLLVGQQQELKQSESLNGFNQNLYNINQPSLTLTYGDNQSATDFGYTWATMSTLGRFNYNYKEKYLIEANGSYMGSSFFPKSSRWHLFTAFSGGWVVSKESFWNALQNTIQLFKLRASYGTLGDLSSFLDNRNYYPYSSNLGTSTPQGTFWIFDASGTRQPSVRPPSQLVSPNITWAKPSMLDLGVDVTFLKDFNFTFDWYKRRIKDLIGPAATYPATLGIAPPQPNNAVTETRGFDLSLGWNHNFGELGINARAILSDYKGKVISYSGNSAGALSNWYNGKVMGEIWGFKTEGLFQTPDEIKTAPSQVSVGSVNWFPGDVRYKDLNNDGSITWGNTTLSDHGDLTVIGNSTPRYSYAFSAGATWRGFDFSFLFQGIGKADFWGGGNYFWGITSTYQSTGLTTLYDRWTPTNPDGYFPKLYLDGTWKNQNASDRYLVNAAYLRLKNTQLGYTLPVRLSQKAHISKCRIYISGENLVTFSPAFKHQFVDPELLLGDSKIYPLQRTISAGININFQ